MSEIIINLAKFPKQYNGKNGIIENFYNYTLRQKNDFSSPEVQSYILKNWWSSNFSSFYENQEIYLNQKEYSLFFELLSWDKLINISDYSTLKNNQNHDDIYRGQNMSWFQYGLLEHWTLIKEAPTHVNPKKFSKGISLINSLEENSWHFLARTLKQSRRTDFMVIVEIIQKFSTISVLQKNTMGQTPTDILRANLVHLELYEKNTSHELIEINLQAIDSLAKIELYEKLNQNLAIDLVHKTKSNKI